MFKTKPLPLPLPDPLMASLSGVPGFSADTFRAVHLSGEQITSLRINPMKWPAPPLGMEVTRVPWSSTGYYLPQRPSFTFDPLFHAGCYYVQEASSMFLEEALTQTTDLSGPLRLLDLCAAPGGKSTLLQSLITPDSLLVSNEVIKQRVGILEENMIKWGGANVVVTQNDPRDFSAMEDYFDVILVDAPCSGSGLFRRDPETIGAWSEENVALCSQRQQRILSDIWPSLRQNGLLIYSTCSYSTCENEEILDWITTYFGATSLPLTLDPAWGIIESVSEKNACFGYRFFPDRVKGEGFFIAVLQKKEGANPSDFSSKRHSPERLSAKELAVCSPWLKKGEPIGLFKHQERIHALPEKRLGEIPYLQSRLYLKKAGILLGRLAGGELVPDHELALSLVISPDIPKTELSLAQAIQYLRKEDIRLETPFLGWALVCYENQRLGWIKILPNRVNNYYPKQSRILKRD